MSRFNPPYAFVCYPRTVRKYVERLADYLAAHDIEVWYDADVRGGDRWETVIAEKLTAAGTVIVIMADDAGEHPWIRREIDEAKNLRKPIVPLLLSGKRYRDLRKVQDDQVDAESMPSLPWITLLRQRLRQVSQPEPGGPPHVETAHQRRLAATIAVVIAAVVALAVYGLHGLSSTNGSQVAGEAGSGRSSSAGAPGGDCAGLAAHIDQVSHESPGHTGRQPNVTVTICRAAPADHQYWIMDYLPEAGGRVSLWAKTRIDGALTTAHPYRVIHSDETEPGSARTYVVVDATTSPDAPVVEEKHWLVSAGDKTPPGMAIVSNEVPAVL